MSLEVISRERFEELTKGAHQDGIQKLTTSGIFISGWLLPDGSHAEHIVNFGWMDKFFHVSADHVNKTDIEDPLARARAAMRIERMKGRE